MRVTLVALLTLILVPAARADVPPYAAGAVTGDGTPAFAWTDAMGVHARIGSGPVATLSADADEGPRITAAGRTVAVIWTDRAENLAAIGTAAAGFGPATDLGTGYVGSLAATGAGDVAVLLVGPNTTSIAFRPAGGTFRTSDVPIPQSASGRRTIGVYVGPLLALGPTGEQLVTWRQGGSMYAVSRQREGPFAAPVTLPGPAPDYAGPAAVALDGHGRALAAWQNWTNTEPPTNVVLVRADDGSWRQIGTVGGVGGRVPQVGTGVEGDALVGWMEGRDFAVAAVSLATGDATAPVRYPVGLADEGVPNLPFANPTFVPPALSVDGAGDAAVTWGSDREVLVARRPAGGTIRSPGVVGCQLEGTAPTALGVDDSGRPEVSFARYPDGQLVIGRDETGQRCRPVGRGGPIRVHYGVRRVVAGRRIRIHIDNLRYPSASIRASWQMPSANRTTHSSSLHYAFPRPGRVTWTVRADEKFENGERVYGRLVTRHLRVYAR